MKSYQCDFSPTVVRFQPSKELVVLVTGDPIATDAIEEGCVKILDFSGNEPLITNSFNTQYQICDSTWSRTIPDHIVLAGGNGFFYVFNPFIPNIDPNVNNNSVFSFHAHDGSVSCVDWNPSKDSFVTASTDRTVKLWTLDESNYREDGTYPHPVPVLSAKWNPANPEIFATISADGSLRIWDRREMDRPDASGVDCDSKMAQCLDWDRTGRFIVVSTPTIRLSKVWDTTDLRNPVRDIPFGNARFLPHLDRGILATSGGGWRAIKHFDRGRGYEWIDCPMLHSSVKILDINQTFQSWFASAGSDCVVILRQHHMQPEVSSAQGSASEPQNDGGPSDGSEQRGSSTRDRDSCCVVL